MHRELYAVARQTTLGAPFTATFPESPRPGLVWWITRMTMEVPNYAGGRISAAFYVAGRFIAGTNQGQNDTSSGPPVRVNESELVTVTWQTTNVPALQQGRASMIVEQVRRGRGPGQVTA